MADYDYLFKILLLGDSGVGKSCLLLRFADDTYTDSFVCTIGVDFKIRTFRQGSTVIKLQMWDTAGQERFRAHAGNSFRNVNGVMVVYDVTDKASFNNVKHWLQQVDRSTEGVNTLLVGNKCDFSSRAVSFDEGQEMADLWGVQFLETSAKTAHNVQAAFETMAQDILQRVQRQGPAAVRNLVSSEQTAREPRDRCYG
ncbi:unnamed protein product [Effrenium voratum]|uniref:Uncharacterized protein n=1 Tax=Effrenium voratum TaxID=2562239 RepID=A0AA36NA57_9DINO|nr:unnamed protein product [Effrenium voratum]